MLKIILRYIKIILILTALDSGISAVICWFIKWRSLREYSNFLFMSTGIFLLISLLGFISTIKNKGNMAKDYMKSSQDNEKKYAYMKYNEDYNDNMSLQMIAAGTAMAIFLLSLILSFYG